MPGAPTPPPRRPADPPDDRRPGTRRRPDRDAAARQGDPRPPAGRGGSSPSSERQGAPDTGRAGTSAPATGQARPSGTTSTSVGMRVRGGTVPREPGTPPPAQRESHTPPPGRRPEAVRPAPPARPAPSDRSATGANGSRTNGAPTNGSAATGAGRNVASTNGASANGARPGGRRHAAPTGGFPAVAASAAGSGAATPRAAAAGSAGTEPATRTTRSVVDASAVSETDRTIVAPSGQPDPDATRAVRSERGPRRVFGRELPAPVARAVAFAEPGVEFARTKLGILDAEQKAALTPQQRRDRRRRQIRYSLIGTAASFVLLPLLMFGLGWAFFSIPTPDDAVNNQIATVSYADGGQLARLVPEQGNRIKVGMNDIPVHVREAVLAAEDRSFYSNPGFDITGILRAGFNQLLGGAGGGSTITQQYVKNTLVGNEASYWRKYRELIVSLKVSQSKTKDEILNDYLNAIYFGRGAYGIQSASFAYFGKPANQLSPSEGALLAGVIQSPSRWDPANDADKARERWSFVLDGMVQQGWLSRTDRAQAQFPPTIPPQNTSNSSSLTDDRGHILNAVKAELSSLGISDQAFSQGGLQVTTTIDPGRQQSLTDAVQKQMDGQPDVLRTGAVAIDPKTGGIVGYYGGKDGTGIDYAKVLKQPGSTFKPFAVLAALMQDPPIGLGKEYDGSEMQGLRNADGANCPKCDIKQALTISNNVVFTKLSAEVGPQKVADAARLAGITSPLDNPDARLALGNKETTPVQLASAYATIADGGVWHAPHMVSKVVNAEGQVLYEYQPGEGEQRFPEQVARNVTEAMLDVVKNDRLTLPSGQQAAGKTGTVQSRFEGQNNDAWFAGFTPDLVTAVWTGTDRNDPIQSASGAPINGKDLPGQVWQSFMSDAVRAADDVVDFPTFRAIGTPPAEEPPNAPTETATPSARPSAEPSTQSVAPAPPPEPVAPAPPPEPAVTPSRTPTPNVNERSDSGLLGGGSSDSDPTFG